MIPRLLVIGAISLLGQVVVLRELAVAFYGTELIYALALGAWLLGTAIGAACGRRGHVPGAARVHLLLLGFAIVLPLLLALARGVRILLGGVPGGYLPFGRQMLALACCVLPVSVLAGLLFQWAAKQWARDGGSFAGAYAWESAGALGGGVLATALLAAGVSNLSAGLVCALAAAAAALPAARAGIRWAAVSLSVGLLAALAWSGALDRTMTAWSHPRLVETHDTPYGRVTVTEQSGQIAVFENDALAYESEGTGAEEFVHLAAVQRERPRAILLLGGAVPGLVREALLHRPERVVDLELDRRLVDVVARAQPASVRGALADARVRVVVGDPRRLLERSGPVDLILVAMPEPGAGRTNRFYTREFFRECAARLGRHGVLALRLRGSENLWTPLRTLRAASIHRALREAFADVVVLPGATQIFLASAAPLERDPTVLAARLGSRDLRSGLVTPAYVRYLYTNDRFAETATLLGAARAPVNSDRRPVCYAATMLLWLSRFFPRLGPAGLPDWGARGLARSPGTWVALAGALALLVLARRRLATRRAVLAGLAGCAGMLVECALLLEYETRSGVLYRDLGLLMTAFMAGLAVGAAAVGRAGGSARSRGLTIGAFVALALAAAAWLGTGSPGGIAATALLLFGCGFLVGAVVAHAALLRRAEQVRVVSPVYAADLLGGCVGSLLAALVLIPFLGLPATALAAAMAIALGW